MNYIWGKVQRNFSKVILLGVLFALCAFLSFKSENFLTTRNLLNILEISSIQIILALGMTFVICTGGIDLSVGSVVALSGVVGAIFVKAGFPVSLAICTALLTAVIIGFINGSVITHLKINHFIVTLAMMSIARGIALIITRGRPIFGFDAGYKYLGSGAILGQKPYVWLAIVAIVIFLILAHKTKFGRYLIALGGNEQALHRSGVNTKFYKIIVYVISAFLAGLVGIILAGKLNTAEPLAGWMMEMDAIAPVVLGGNSMSGGKALIGGTIIACIILAVIQNGLVMLSIDTYYQQLISGLIILIAVIASEARGRKKDA